jgi:O-antigen/teichoic acid export membrane protein
VTGWLAGDRLGVGAGGRRLAWPSAGCMLMTTHAAPGRIQGWTATLRRHTFARTIAGTAGFNMTSMVAAGLGGVVVARATGPVVQGEYSAVTAWFGVAMMVGGMGQPAALCFYVARDPCRAREYVATSRAMMLATGIAALAAGVLLAPFLAHGQPAVIAGYRIAFGASLLAFVGASYTFSLQARDMRRWNVVRVSQPLLSVIAICVLWRLKLLTLDAALAVLPVTMFMQLCWAYGSCRKVALVPGKAGSALVRPLSVYGMAQIAALTPATLNAQLDQLVLSQTVPPADLGRYAIAVSLSLVPVPLIAAIGNVAFPRLASETGVTAKTRRLQRAAVICSLSVASALLIPFAVVAHWLVPLVFGARYAGAVPMLWILTPGTIFLACGQVVGDLLRGRSHPNVAAWAQGLAAIFTVVLLVVLLPIVGVYGAAIASTVSYGVALAVMLRRLWRLPRHARGRWLNTPHHS